MATIREAVSSRRDPWPGSVLYNALSSSGIFLRHYELVAHDVANYGGAGCILDIGTGPGHLLLAMRKVFPDSKLVGVDISPPMVAQAQRDKWDLSPYKGESR